jgi:hypothetical protein
MRTVYIDFTSSRKLFPFFSWAIQLFERTPYSHVRIHWRSSWFSWTTFEASGTEVKIIGAVGEKHHPVKVHHRYEVSLTDDEYKKLIGLLRYAGVSYGIKQAFGILLQRLFNLKKNPYADRKYSMICSELVAYFLMEVMNMTPFWEAESVGPRKIKEYMDAMPAFFKKIDI